MRDSSLSPIRHKFPIELSCLKNQDIVSRKNDKSIPTFSILSPLRQKRTFSNNRLCSSKKKDFKNTLKYYHNNSKVLLKIDAVTESLKTHLVDINNLKNELKQFHEEKVKIPLYDALFKKCNLPDPIRIKISKSFTTASKATTKLKNQTRCCTDYNPIRFCRTRTASMYKKDSKRKQLDGDNARAIFSKTFFKNSKIVNFITELDLT